MRQAKGKSKKEGEEGENEKVTSTGCDYDQRTKRLPKEFRTAQEEEHCPDTTYDSNRIPDCQSELQTQELKKKKTTTTRRNGTGRTPNSVSRFSKSAKQQRKSLKNTMSLPLPWPG